MVIVDTNWLLSDSIGILSFLFNIAFACFASADFAEDQIVKGVLIGQMVSSSNFHENNHLDTSKMKRHWAPTASRQDDRS